MRSGECIELRHTNEMPKRLARDDFGVETPTDTVGQHIHLVKFDVTSLDGSANGWNYENGTFVPDEIAERTCASQPTSHVSWQYPAQRICFVGSKFDGPQGFKAYSPSCSNKLRCCAGCSFRSAAPSSTALKL